jgi:hypothetical protein
LEMLASALHSASPIRADNLLQMCSTTVMDLHSDLVRTLPIFILPFPSSLLHKQCAYKN